ncbi:hypothetical protein GTA08_BOTSDO08429 [Botryosphaeria dothidea]|uniref:Uncharacterized protein n=1 Tax=Botryosphaeria dothidea TaxID=55169 RepID=A0A8H4IR54_9PEZI|nr:hypothetical protein GTA08_BOTSDO08429 [Botryosphaeria dothidea]
MSMGASAIIGATFVAIVVLTLVFFVVYDRQGRSLFASACARAAAAGHPHTAPPTPNAARAAARNNGDDIELQVVQSHRNTGNYVHETPSPVLGSLSRPAMPPRTVSRGRSPSTSAPPDYTEREGNRISVWTLTEPPPAYSETLGSHDARTVIPPHR